MQDRYLFANQAVCEKLIKCGRPGEAMGKTELYFAQRERNAGHRHTFGGKIDGLVLRKSSRNEENGTYRAKDGTWDQHRHVRIQNLEGIKMQVFASNGSPVDKDVIEFQRNGV
jgi:hypothetical protein